MDRSPKNISLCPFPSRIKQFNDVNDVLRSLRNGTTQDVYLTSKQIVDYDNLLHFREAKILYTKEAMHLLPFSVYFQKDSCLLQTFNRQLSALIESGLMQALIARFTRTVHMHEDSEPQQMRVDQFLGTFKSHLCWPPVCYCFCLNCCLRMLVRSKMQLTFVFIRHRAMIKRCELSI